MPSFIYESDTTDVTDIANNDTIYVIETPDGTDGDTKFAAYTGYKAVPSVKAGSGNLQVAYAENDDQEVTFVYIDATGANAVVGDTETGDMLFVTSTTYTTHETTDKVYYTISGTVNGVAGTTVKTEDADLIDELTDKGYLYELKTDNDGFVTAATKQTTSGTSYISSEVQADASKGVLDGYTYDGTETVYVVDSANSYAIREGKASEAKDGNTIYVKVVKTTAKGGSAAENIAISVMYIVK